MIHREVWKYPISFGDITPLEMPLGAKFVAARIESEPHTAEPRVNLWFEVEPDRMEKTTRAFQLYGTGHRVHDRDLWVATVFGPAHFVWHIYEVPHNIDRSSPTAVAAEAVAGSVD